MKPHEDEGRPRRPDRPSWVVIALQVVQAAVAVIRMLRDQ